MKRLILLLKIFVILLVLINLVILLSGRFYIYKGVWYTYLQGKTGPTIYDLDKFPYVTIHKGDSTFHFSTDDRDLKLTTVEEKHFEKWDTRSFLVIKDDKIIFEKYFQNHTDTTHSNSFSAAKTVVGLLIGCALDDGKIKSLDESVGNYLPEFKKRGREIVTIRDLLTMASGLSWEESGKNPFSDNAASYYGTDLYKLATRQKVVSTPGKLFFYQSGNTQLLAFILEKATGKSINEYASEKIWSQIGTQDDAYWSLDRKNGNEKAFCCIYATTRDFAKLGRLLLHRGIWNGKRLVSEHYFNEFSSPAPLTTEEGIPNTRYGFQVWLYPRKQNPLIYCRGILGQYIVAIPDENLIFVRTGMNRDENVLPDEAKDNLLKVGHPRDFFDYLNAAERLTKQYEERH